MQEENQKELFPFTGPVWRVRFLEAEGFDEPYLSSGDGDEDSTFSGFFAARIFGSHRQAEAVASRLEAVTGLRLTVEKAVMP